MAVVPKMRAMTITGMCIHLRSDHSTWRDYAKQEDFSKVATRVEDIIFSQKFEGASADLLNANIIARDLSLVDKKDINHVSEDGSMTPKGMDAFYAAVPKEDEAGE